MIKRSTGALAKSFLWAVTTILTWRNDMNVNLRMILHYGMTYAIILEKEEAVKIINDWKNGQIKPSIFSGLNKNGSLWAVRIDSVMLMDYTPLSPEQELELLKMVPNGNAPRPYNPNIFGRS
jgi:hypothetical protein